MVAAVLLATLMQAAGCAFDIVQVKQLPVSFTPATGTRHFLLQQPVSVRIGTGFPVHLRAFTKWVGTGTTEFGDVYTSPDQVVTVEGSNINEAAIVVRDDVVTGFYLLIEKKFCPATQPVKLVTSPQ